VLGQSGGGGLHAAEVVGRLRAVAQGEFGVDEDQVNDFNGGNQWSAGISGDYESFGFGVVYTQLESDGGPGEKAEAGELLVGGSFGWEAFAVGAYYATILNASGTIEDRDGDDAYGLTVQYDLGGGASINGGVGQTFNTTIGDDDSTETVADFGIKMAF
jgi:hypothetical protein